MLKEIKHHVQNIVTLLQSTNPHKGGGAKVDKANLVSFLNRTPILAPTQQYGHLIWWMGDTL
jgi:hypothetical protein